MLSEKAWKEFSEEVNKITKPEVGALKQNGDFYLNEILSCSQVIELGKIMVMVQRTIMEGG